MPTRHQRLIASALSKTKSSPETFAAKYGSAIAYYSSRQVRRWRNGEVPIPAPVAKHLRSVLPILSPETR